MFYADLPASPSSRSAVTSALQVQRRKEGMLGGQVPCPPDRAVWMPRALHTRTGVRCAREPHTTTPAPAALHRIAHTHDGPTSADLSPNRTQHPCACRASPCACIKAAHNHIGIHPAMHLCRCPRCTLPHHVLAPQPSMPMLASKQPIMARTEAVRAHSCSLLLYHSYSL